MYVAGRRLFVSSFKNFIRGICYFFAPKLVSVFKVRFIEKSIGDLLTGAFWETVEMRESSNIKRNDLVDLLINLKNEDNEMADRTTLAAQAITFFTAGQEATSSLLAFTLYELSLNKSIQDKIREEVTTMIDKHGGLTYEAVKDMEYTTMALRETLRKYPFTPTLNRLAAENYKFTNHDLVIEKGMNVTIPIHGIHYDPEFYPDPYKYDPERFTEENKSSRPLCTFLSFGDGPRMCIGKYFCYVRI